MITVNVLSRVFHLRISDRIATGFAIEAEGKEYLITAGHFAGHLIGENTIEISQNGGWHPLLVTTVGHADGEVGISVVSPTHPITTPKTRFPMPASSKGLEFGQDVYFLGFPYGIDAMIWPHDERNHRPLPFIKRAVVSMFPSESHGYFILDGHNNTGFSGGPVVFRREPNSEFRVAAVVTAYKQERKPILDSSGAPIEMFLEVNTGLIVAYDINWALKLIEANPIGVELTER